MSQHQTNSGLWVSGDSPIPASTNIATRPVKKHRAGRSSHNVRREPPNAQVYDPASGLSCRWPPKLPQAAWLIAGPAIIGVLVMMAFALLLIGSVANNIFF